MEERGRKKRVGRKRREMRRGSRRKMKEEKRK
jgi:hypothetical protein